MKFHVVLRYMGMVMLLNATFMLLSAIVSMLNNFDTAFYPLLLSFIVAATLGAFPMIFVGRTNQISTKEGYIIVVGSWIVSCLIGMFPYMLWGGEFNLVNAWFESTSGFTATGATILNDIEALPRGLLFWRSSTHWLGGVGVVMFALVILPSLGRTKMMLSSVEMSSMAKDNYKYRTQKIVQILLFVYVGMTILETMLLKIAGMTWFDAVNHSFSTIATGGFSTKNLSVAHFNSVWIEGIISFFMILAGIHFGLIFAAVTGRFNNLLRSEVTKFYLLSILIGTIIVTASIITSGTYSDIYSALRYGGFQVIAIASTTGFATADTTAWTPLAIVVLTYLTVQCACAGSTTGGVKADRILLAAKAIKAKILLQQHPNAIIRIKLNNVTQDQETINSVILYIVFYFFIVAVSTMVCAACGLDLMTSLSLAMTSLSNVGIGFGDISSMSNYADLSSFLKCFSSFLMILGRLEIFGLILLFMIKWWR